MWNTAHFCSLQCAQAYSTCSIFLYPWATHYHCRFGCDACDDDSPLHHCHCCCCCDHDVACAPSPVLPSPGVFSLAPDDASPWSWCGALLHDPTTPHNGHNLTNNYASPWTRYTALLSNPVTLNTTQWTLTNNYASIVQIHRPFEWSGNT